MRLINLIVVSLTIIICSSSVSTSQNIDWNKVYQDYLIQFSPPIAPDWVFPIIIKDGSGIQDTLFAIYESKSDGGGSIDSSLGFYPLKMRSNRFNACFGCSWSPDQRFKVHVTNEIDQFKFDVDGRNIKLPITFYWNFKLLYHDSLPFEKIPGIPRIMGLIQCHNVDFSYPNCAGGGLSYWFVGDTVPPVYSNLQKVDSFLYDGNPNDTFEIIGINLTFEKWGIVPLEIEPATNSERLHLFPNPSNGIVSINGVSHGDVVSLFSLNGKLCGKYEFMENNQVKLNLTNFPPGVYILRLNTRNSTAHSKLIIR